MTDHDRRERTLARHAGDQASVDTLDVGHHSSLMNSHHQSPRVISILMFYITQYFQCLGSLVEGAQENEPNTVEIRVTKTMTKQDVVDKVLQEI